jgi:hypothetical protein
MQSAIWDLSLKEQRMTPTGTKRKIKIKVVIVRSLSLAEHTISGTDSRQFARCRLSAWCQKQPLVNHSVNDHK